nr:E3 ubiquitin-protein ligase MARCH8-like [Ipomoea batatas]
MGSFASFPNSDFNSLKKRTEKGVLESKSADMSSSKMVECRICHDEDLDSTMETPCSCRGTLKGELRIIPKGDTTNDRP